MPKTTTELTNCVHDDGSTLPIGSISWADSRVSLYPQIDVVTGGADMLLSDVIEDIRSGKYREQIEVIREHYRRGGKHDEQYKTLKSLLAYFTPGGICDRRSSAGLVLPSGCVQGDIDELNMRQLVWARDSLCGDPHTVYVFTSPGGGGIKFAFAIEPVCCNDAYKAYFYGLEHYVRRKYGFKLDPQCKSISHPCYVSDDAEAYFNPYPTLFTEHRTPPQQHITSSPITHPIPTSTPQLIRATPTASRQLQWALFQLRSAPLGTRHNTRMRIGCLVGGWIAGGQIAPEAADILSEIASDYSLHPAQARRDIADGLRYGAARPLLPENKAFDTLAERARSRGRYFHG